MKKKELFATLGLHLNDGFQGLVAWIGNQTKMKAMYVVMKAYLG